MKLKRFTDAGLVQFKFALQALRDDPRAAMPLGLNQAPYAEYLGNDFILPSTPTAPSKLEAGVFLTDVFRLACLPENLIKEDVGLWAWISYWMLDWLMPADGTGTRKAHETAIYIYDPSDMSNYRTTLRTAWLLVLLHGPNHDVLMGILHGSTSKNGEVYEQVLSVDGVFSNRDALGLATKLYYDRTKNQQKYGSASKDKGGSARRYREVMGQLALTYDLREINADELEKLLPAEFDRFKQV